MAKKSNRTPTLGHDGDYYAKVARKNGFDVAEGSRHTKLYPPDGRTDTTQLRPFMSVPRHASLSPGVERAIIKWLLKFGAAFALILMAVIALGGVL